MVVVYWILDLVGAELPWTKNSTNILCCEFHDPRRRQHQQHEEEDSTKAKQQESFSSNMACSHSKISPIIPVLVCFLLVASSMCPVAQSSDIHRESTANETLNPEKELKKLKIIRARLPKINKPALKTIQSPDGDLIDCVLSHHQPAFDHPQLRGQKPLDPPERPKGRNRPEMATENYQLWSMSGNLCPEGTVPIRRTRKEDMMRASSVKRFGRKLSRHVRRDTSSNGHEIISISEEKLSFQFPVVVIGLSWLLLLLGVALIPKELATHHHAVGYVSGDQYYGAKASINVWAPTVVNQYEFSLSQMWVISGSFGDDLNTIEAGWQVSPELYGDNYPRFFTYWTTDAYQATGCYNLLCSGFVQTNSRIAIGAAISPTSSYHGGQFDISLLIWKDPKHGNWWLEFGNGVLVGYWPSFLFTHLQDHASMVQFGGEVVNSMPSGSHTATQMGSGHFAGEGFGKASYFRNMQVVDWDNSLIPLSNLKVLADHPNCYDIQGGINNFWGNYFYYGGPGRNVRCP